MTAYPLESSDRERDRLERQARVLRPLTERLMRAAGAKPGASILDLGTGAGDVALLAAEIVGPAGRVVSIERDPNNIERATQRATAAGASNITFVRGDIADPPLENFDLSIGRYVLMYQAEPAAVVRSVARAVRPGGAVAFHELNLYDGMLANGWPAGDPKQIETMVVLGAAMRRLVQNNLGPRLPSIMEEAGLDISAWNFEIAAPLAKRDDAAVLNPGIMRTFTPLAVAQGMLKPEDVDADGAEAWWRNQRASAALMLPPTVLGWATKAA